MRVEKLVDSEVGKRLKKVGKKAEKCTKKGLKIC